MAVRVCRRKSGVLGFQHELSIAIPTLKTLVLVTNWYTFTRHGKRCTLQHKAMDDNDPPSGKDKARSRRKRRSQRVPRWLLFEPPIAGQLHGWSDIQSMTAEYESVELVSYAQLVREGRRQYPQLEVPPKTKT